MLGFLPARRDVRVPHIIGAAVIGFSVAWTLRVLLRQLIKSLYPQAFPGTKNTALLATVQTKASTTTTKDLEDVVEYDYIIVGTGTAGCVLANRLSEDPRTTVLAIEAGDSDLKQIFSRIPAGAPRLWKSIADWNLSTTAQPGCDGRSLYWPRGKMIGGCSSANAMMYNKGSPDDYDEWERLGNKGWGYRDMIPYLKKSEKFHQPRDDDPRKLGADDLAQHGQDGPWSITYPVQVGVAKAFPDACDSIGITKTPDVNTDRGILGASPVQTFIDTKGQRSSAAVAYLTADVIQRPNLKIASGQSVTRIIFDNSGSQPRAIGVEMAASKVSPLQYLAKAGKEVLLCAGSIGTPQLLKISGVGPAEELKQHGISIVKALPGVGENLMDHIVFPGLTFKTDKSASAHYLQDPVASLPGVVQWFRDGTGPMASQACDSFAFVRSADRDDAPADFKSNDRTSGAKSADLELICMSLCFTKHGKWVAPQTDGYAQLSSVGLRPESRGTIKLATNSVFDAPLIDPNSLSTKYDLDILLYGTRLCIKIAKSEAYKHLFKGWYQGPHHPLNWDTATDEEIRALIRKSCETLYHPMGTAKMGRGDDAVVDAELRVRGVRGLRVVDASIFPTALACHPCAPVIAVAEKVADMIKGEM
ncbi:hypothetical protein EG328_008205 [Venturia inaequalis]|uniref:Glucose-methanol-choline oxidoreductase N-terminal domain-containing protein n=1 Tax=Venturia inaequalis TaxID=5025 RepID=A0A8H3UBG2_VENIN|nr:hypothetical protein EG328_008205 [Venturia inaequalis]